MVDETKTIAGAIIFGLGAIAAAIKWSANKFTRAQDRGVTALIENARAAATLTATLTAKFETLASRFDNLASRFDHILEILVRSPNITESQKQRIASRTKSTPRIALPPRDDDQDGGG